MSAPIERDFDLARLTTVRAGGRADMFARPGSEEELVAALAYAEAEGAQVGVVGSGSNLLVSDDGFRGLVLKLDRDLAQIERDGLRLLCGAGVRLPSAAAKAASSSRGVRATHCPFPSYPSRRVLRIAGRPTWASAASSSGFVATGANGAVGIPITRKSVFSASRSCEAATAAGGGNTSMRPSSDSRAATATFSISSVTTSTTSASFASARGSSSEPKTDPATCAPGASGLVSSSVQSMPSAYPASASMRPATRRITASSSMTSTRAGASAVERTSFVGAGAASRAAGSQTRNVAPTPGFDSASMCPLCFRTIDRTVARPSPLLRPLLFVEK